MTDTTAARTTRADAATAAGAEPSVAEPAVDGLISRLAVIDQQPLERRAEAFAQVHDELRSVLERGETRS